MLTYLYRAPTHRALRTLADTPRSTKQWDQLPINSSWKGDGRVGDGTSEGHDIRTQPLAYADGSCAHTGGTHVTGRMTLSSGA